MFNAQSLHHYTVVGLLMAFCAVQIITVLSTLQDLPVPAHFFACTYFGPGVIPTTLTRVSISLHIDEGVA